MEYITVKEAALKWNISERSVQNYCANEKIPGAKCIGKQWLIPSSSERPIDGRSKNIKSHPEITAYHFPLFVHSSFFTNKADYQLLLVGLQSHATRNFTSVSDIDINKLSFDAIYYYRYLLMMSDLVNLTVDHSNTVNSFLSLLRELEIKGITPTALCVDCLLSFFYKRLGDKSKQKLYMQKACDIAVQTRFNSLFTKYYLIQPKLIDECLSKHNNDYIKELKIAENELMTKWLVVHKIASGFSPLPEFTIEQNEILILMPGSVTLETIAKIKNIPLKKVEEIIEEILKISGVESLDKLTKYAREKFNEMPKEV